MKLSSRKVVHGWDFVRLHTVRDASDMGRSKLTTRVGHKVNSLEIASHVRPWSVQAIDISSRCIMSSMECSSDAFIMLHHVVQGVFKQHMSLCCKMLHGNVQHKIGMPASPMARMQRLKFSICSSRPGAPRMILSIGGPPSTQLSRSPCASTCALAALSTATSSGTVDHMCERTQRGCARVSDKRVRTFGMPSKARVWCLGDPKRKINAALCQAGCTSTLTQRHHHISGVDTWVNAVISLESML